MCGPRRHRNDQDRLQFSIYLKGRMKLPESVLQARPPYGMADLYRIRAFLLV